MTKSKPYLPLGYDCNGNTVRARRCGQYSTLISMTGLRMSHRDRQIVLLTNCSRSSPAGLKVPRVFAANTAIAISNGAIERRAAQAGRRAISRLGRYVALS